MALIMRLTLTSSPWPARTRKCLPTIVTPPAPFAHFPFPSTTKFSVLCCRSLLHRVRILGKGPRILTSLRSFVRREADFSVNNALRQCTLPAKAYKRQMSAESSHRLSTDFGALVVVLRGTASPCVSCCSFANAGPTRENPAVLEGACRRMKKSPRPCDWKLENYGQGQA